jgi:hypothetical protein
MRSNSLKICAVGRRVWVALARRAVVVALTAGFLLAGSVTGDAFTLIFGKPYVTVTPTSGLPTATFTVRGKYVWPTQCPSPFPITFKFYWYKVISNKILIWTKTANCVDVSRTSGLNDTGNSPAFVPPPPLNYPGTFVIQVAVYDSTGAHMPVPYTNTTLYTVVAPKPTPSPSPRPSPSQPCGQPGTAPCPSATPTSCAAPSAALPPASPSGKDAAVLFALVVIGALPIGGIAMVFSPGLWTHRRRWSQLLALLGLSLLLLTAAGCTWNPNQTAQETPTQSEPSPSASPSTSC